MTQGDRQNLIGRREVVLGGLMAAASGVAFVRQPVAYMPAITLAAFEDLVPKQVGEWRFAEASGVVLPPPDTLRDRLYDNLVTRVYLNAPYPPIMLVLAYKYMQDGIIQVHRPEVCYPASGFSLDSERSIALDLADTSVPAKAFVARRDQRIEQVLYFTRLGVEFPLSWIEQRTAVLSANLAGEIPDGLLGRVSIIHPDQSIAIRLLAEFLSRLAADGRPGLRDLLLGVSPDRMRVNGN